MALIQAVRALGYAWAEKTYADTLEGADEGLAEIQSQLRLQQPVLADLTLPGGGHTVVIEGVDVGHRRLFVVDPDAPAPGRRIVSFEQFAKIWNEHAYGGNFRSLIVTQPKSAR